MPQLRARVSPKVVASLLGHRLPIPLEAWAKRLKEIAATYRIGLDK